MEACDAKGSKSRRNPVPQIPIGTFAHQIRIRRDPIVVSTSDGSGQFFGLALAEQPQPSISYDLTNASAGAEEFLSSARPTTAHHQPHTLRP